MKKISLLSVVILLGFILFSCGNGNNNNAESEKTTETKELTKKEKDLASLKSDGIVVPEELVYSEEKRKADKPVFEGNDLDSMSVVKINQWLIDQLAELQKNGWQQWKPVTETGDEEDKDEYGFYTNYWEEFKLMNKTIAIKTKADNTTQALYFYISYTYPIQKEGNKVSLSIRKEVSRL